MANKLACEEAADLLLDDYMPALTHMLENERRKPRIELQGGLRAEGRELKALRRIALNADSEPAYLTIKALIRIATRIQKARKK